VGTKTEPSIGHVGDEDYTGRDQKVSLERGGQPYDRWQRSPTSSAGGPKKGGNRGSVLRIALEGAVWERLAIVGDTEPCPRPHR
jgi:hypothetical protein